MNRLSNAPVRIEFNGEILITRLLIIDGKLDVFLYYGLVKVLPNNCNLAGDGVVACAKPQVVNPSGELGSIE